MRYYFDVTEAYVWNKLKLVACPLFTRDRGRGYPEQVAAV